MSEKQTLRTIQAVYKKALQDIENKLVISNGKIETLLKDIDSLTDEQQSILQSQIYQRKMQRSLKSQLEIMLKDLAVNQYRTVNDYLKNSYQNGYIGALYNINMQGMPLILPVDPYLVHRAIEIDSKIKHGLYQNLVDKVDVFKRRIANDISRGIASSASYHDMAAWIRHDTKVSVGKSMRIVRTEGNRVYNAATLDCGKGAKERGCDLVKVWDSTLDMKTRPTHRECDGQVKELNEDFKNANGEAKAPGQFGIASEDINCRCAVLIKPRWDVDSRFTKRDNQSGELKEFEGVKEYEEFKEKYWKNIGKTEGKTTPVPQLKQTPKAPAPQEKSQDMPKTESKPLSASKSQPKVENKTIQNDRISDINAMATETLKKNYEENRKHFNLNLVFADNISGGWVDYKNIPTETAEQINKTITQLQKKYYSTLSTINTKKEQLGIVAEATPAGFSASTHITLNSNALKDTDRLLKMIEYNSTPQKGKFIARAVEVEKGKELEYSITHEFAHSIFTTRSRKELSQIYGDEMGAKLSSMQTKMKKLHKDYVAEVADLQSKFDKINKEIEKNDDFDFALITKGKDISNRIKDIKISTYAASNVDEFIAEAFTQMQIGKHKSPYSKKVLELLDEIFKK